MVFSGGTLSSEAANARFDVMLRTADEIPLAKQPVILRRSGRIAGYCGVAWFEFEGRRRLEFSTSSTDSESERPPGDRVSATVAAPVNGAPHAERQSGCLT
jgi:hypothetical protein